VEWRALGVCLVVGVGRRRFLIFLVTGVVVWFRSQLVTLWRQFSFDVFLSYSSKDKVVVRPIAERLRADGLRVWFDDWELKPGHSIPAKN